MRESEGKGEVGEKRGRKRENREGGGWEEGEEEGERGDKRKRTEGETGEYDAGTCSCSSSGMLTALLRW